MKCYKDGYSCARKRISFGTKVSARKSVAESLALSTEASRDNTGLEFSFAFSVHPTVLACARKWGGPSEQTARNLDGATQPGAT